MNNYIIPVEQIKISNIKVEANLESEAVAKVKKFINEIGTSQFDSTKILEDQVYCLEDEEIIEQVEQDLGKEDKIKGIKKVVIGDIVTHVAEPLSNDEVYTKTYTVFSGMDCVIILNKKVCGEIDTFEVDSIKKQIIISVSNFLSLTEILKELSEIKNSELYEIYSNEYGEKMYRKFCNLKYIGETYSISIDSLNPLHKLTFEYTPSEDNFYKEIEKGTQDFIKDIKNGEA